MKKIFVLSFIFMIAFTAYAEQTFKIKFYRKNGQEPLTYNIYDIQKIGIRNISDKYIMKIHFQDTNTAYYPVMSIDSVKFETDTNHIKFFTPYIFGTPIPYSIAEIDSIIFNDIETITIGSQVWMLKNLDVSTYSNGEQIRYAPSDEDWVDAGNKGEGAWCYYNNDPANGEIYGKLYNWYAVNDPRGLAPGGFHVPRDAEWTILTTYLGGWLVAGGKMKETGTDHWYDPNYGATNSSGFSALPCGSRNQEGTYYDQGYYGLWWSSSELDDTSAWCRGITYLGGTFDRCGNLKIVGYSVRCLRD